MAIVTVKNKYQVVIPRSVRDEIGVAIGDVFDARVRNGKIVYEPKAIVDRGIAKSVEEFKAGRAHGPFATHKQFLASLHKEAKKLDPRKSKRAAR
jgi:AbrB family looped-hinge helix DNA binding protein